MTVPSAVPGRLDKTLLAGALAGLGAGGLAIATTYLVTWASIWALYNRRSSPFALSDLGPFFGGWYNFAATEMAVAGSLLLVGAAVVLLSRDRYGLSLAGGVVMTAGSVIVGLVSFYARGTSDSSTLYLGIIYHRGPGLWICSSSALLGLVTSGLVVVRSLIRFPSRSEVATQESIAA
jgi:hypothetical protein